MKATLACSRSARKAHTAGFSMLEMLVSIIVLTMGLLSVAGLNARSLAANDSSGYRASAGQLAMRISDAMRANRDATFRGDYVLTMGQAAPAASTKAGADLTSWKTALSALPAGDGSVAYSNATRQATVIVRWNDQRAGGDVVSDFTYAFRP